MLCISSVILALILNICVLEYVSIWIIRIIKLKRENFQEKHAKGVNIPDVIEKAEIQRAIMLKKFGPMNLRKHFWGSYSRLKNEDIKVLKLAGSSFSSMRCLF